MSTTKRTTQQIMQEPHMKKQTDIIKDGDEYLEDNGQWLPVTAEDINICVSDSGYKKVRYGSVLKTK